MDLQVPGVTYSIVGQFGPKLPLASSFHFRRPSRGPRERATNTVPAQPSPHPHSSSRYPLLSPSPPSGAAATSRSGASPAISGHGDLGPWPPPDAGHGDRRRAGGGGSSSSSRALGVLLSALLLHGDQAGRSSPRGWRPGAGAPASSQPARDWRGEQGRVLALREIKNQIIGNRTKKLLYLRLGAVPAVVAALAQPAASPAAPCRRRPLQGASRAAWTMARAPCLLLARWGTSRGSSPTPTTRLHTTST
nr:uncharacterized protein LOC127311447 [Lolium perenne]